MPIIKKHFSLSPLNDNPANVSASTAGGGNPLGNITGGFSSKDGYPTIKFSIPPQPAMLETKSLRLVGQILIKESNGQLRGANSTGADGARELASGDTMTAPGTQGGSIETDNGAGMSKQTALNMNNWGGIKNVVDKVIIQSKKSLIELSSAINYGQYVSLNEAYANNKIDYLKVPLNRALSMGANADLSNRRVLFAPKHDTIANGGFESLSSSNDRMVGQFFSIPISVDLLNVSNLMLDDDYLGGLLITLHLAPDSAVFYNRWNKYAVAHMPQNDQSSVNYVLKNVKLEGRYVVPTPEDIAQSPRVVPLDSRLNLINDVHSSINSNSYTPQLQMVKSVVSVFLDNDQTNSFNKNANNFRNIPGHKKLQQAKNGLRFPQNYAIESKPNHESIVENGAGAWEVQNLENPVNGYRDPEKNHLFERAILDGAEPYHSSNNLTLSNLSLVEDYDTTGAGANAVGNNCKADCVGIGTDFTLNIGLTQDFVNQDYNLTINSGVNTGKASAGGNRNGAVTANPLLQQTFVKHQGQFDTQNLVKVI